MHCCKRPNYDFCISQGSVATVSKQSKLNYSHSRQGSLMLRVKNYQNWPMFHGVIQKKGGPGFFDTREREKIHNFNSTVSLD